MKVRFNRQEMAEVLSTACSVAAVRTPKPVLQCVRIEARSDVLLLSATDLELSVRCTVLQVEVDEQGETLAMADTFARIVRECPDETLSLEMRENMLHVRGKGSHFQIVTHDVADFPPIPELDGEPDFSIENAVLRELIEHTVFAAARESSRYAINGVLWEVDGELLKLVATDGRRLAYTHGRLVAPVVGSKPSTIVPGKALSLFRSLPVAPDAMVAVKIGDNQLLLHVSGAMVSTSLVEGHFPKYEDVIPNDLDRHVRMNTNKFQGALKRAALLTNEESKGVRVSFSDGDLTLSSRAPEQGEATVSMPVEYKGDAIDIGFNPVFLLDVLRVTREDEITFSFREANRPGVISVGDKFVYVVMPVNLSSA